MIIIVFGLAASGKTYIGNVLAKHFGFYHEDADHWLSEEMKQYVIEKKLFTLEMLEGFTQTIIANITELAKKHKNIVISQALYRQKNRLHIKEYFEALQDILFLQVEASDERIYQRLVNRGGWVMPEYATDMRKYFEGMEDAEIIRNNKDGEEEIVKQIKGILG